MKGWKKKTKKKGILTLQEKDERKSLEWEGSLGRRKEEEETEAERKIERKEIDRCG